MFGIVGSPWRRWLTSRRPICWEEMDGAEYKNVQVAYCCSKTLELKSLAEHFETVGTCPLCTAKKPKKVRDKLVEKAALGDHGEEGD